MLLPQEQRPHVAAELVALQQRRDKSDRQHSNTERRLAMPEPGPQLTQARVYVHAAVKEASMGGIRQNAMELSHPSQATYFVVQDIGSPSMHCRWAAAIRGGTLVTPGYLEAGRGPAAAYSPAISVQRRIHVSQAFAQAHPVLTEILTRCMSLPQSRWRHLRDAAACQAAARDLRVIGLVTKAEKRAQEGIYCSCGASGRSFLR
jgi:hypothetical protein